MINHEAGLDTLPISPGVYRVSQLAEAFRASRSSINRYIEKLGIALCDTEYQGKTVKGVSLDEETIRGIDQLVKQGRSQLLTGLATHGLADSGGGQPPNTPVNDSALLVVNAKLDAANQRIIDLEAKLKEKSELYNRIISSKDNELTAKNSEISTLKTSMVMMERLKRYSALDVGEHRPGPLARLGQWLNGFRKPNQPAASYQQIDPIVEPVEDAEADFKEQFSEQ